jgi:hypothetical protein
MNESEFDAGLRTALSTQTATAMLDAKIDAALSRHLRRGRVVRRFAYSCAATAAVALAIWCVPVIQAQAAISRIAGALDAVATVTVSKFTVDANGGRSPAGTIYYDHGRWRMNDGTGGRLTYYLKGKTYSLDETIGAFVVQDTADGPFSRNASSFKASDLLREAEGDTWTRRATVDQTTLNGREVRRLTLDNGQLPERYVFYADPQTDLPIQVECLTQELGNWRVADVMLFDYNRSIDPRQFEPDFKRYPVLTKAEADAKFEEAVTSKDLADVPLKRGRLVVRSFDVAKDGTVFVLFQSGDSTANSFGGFALDLKSDDGTEFLRPQFFGTTMPGATLPAEGRFEVATFVPLEPEDPWQTHVYSLSTHRSKDGTLARELICEVHYLDGSIETTHAPATGSGPNDVVSEVPVMRTAIEKPTCEVRPESLTRIDSMWFGNDVVTEMQEAALRANRYMCLKRWNDALRWSNEELRLKRLHESLGYGSWSQDDTLQRIRSAEAALAAAGG